MAPKVNTSTPELVGPDRLGKERAALKAALESPSFQARPRLAALLEYLCERYFEGETEGIKEYSIATEVFHRPDSFDPSTDSIVRVEAFRLRRKLREFYDGEGADQAIEIVIATGHYRPEFIDRLPLGPRLRAQVPAPFEQPNRHRAEVDRPETDRDSELIDPRKAVQIRSEAKQKPIARGPGYQHTINTSHRGWRPASLASGAVLVLLAIAAAIWQREHLRKGATPHAEAAEPLLSVPAGPEVRIRCGYSRPIFKDNEGNVWQGDRYYSGGFATEFPNEQIARTRSPELYRTARSGVFSYKIPLGQGVYELRLHFAETTYTPISALGGGENSRVFDVRLNGHPLLTQFDIVSDAGANTADIRVFRDVSPDKDGYLHLDFNGSLGLPTINAIEIVPGLAHRLRPIRMVAQNSFYVDKSGNMWVPDAYFSSGRLADEKVAVSGTPEQGLFAGDRYGNFTYALPVDEGIYKMTLYFSEQYWGVISAQTDSVGRRVFDIYCNGVALTRGLDIAREAGPAQALVKVYHGLRPNAQGKLVVSFVPEINYASVNAVEIEQEGP